MRSIFLYIILGVTFFSCEEPFRLDQKQVPDRIVIDGLLTDHPGYQSVKLTKGADFYSSGKTPRITNAVVTVSDDEGNRYPFVHNPHNVPDSAGIYLPQTPFTGTIGVTYTLHVTVDGQLYEGSDKLASVLTIDSLTTRINQDEFKKPEVPGRFIEILLFAKEPQNAKNFYLFKFFRNDSLLYANDNDIYYSDDELLAENIDGVSGPLYYKKDELAKIEIYSLSRIGYVYYNDLSSLINGDSGGMFGPVPASPRTNLTNGALGLFQVSSVHDKEIKVELKK
jgi:hypothetical protein